ncbi:3-carboxy-cis,cis-mucoante lactonizing enzyme [Wolfiporia cocos MD-104 SS10]|uniref:3-carboxy-cis,cis-mucoante lactonizing enzyme n=1 Tax=Wolfiporia cocos (strain MD-104) TaxID=742152 RepID=A0A2H3JI12_WOLCO|nr:3-carboxy-cis,cis-mucoante lactonizing enzyme [Wolfiporia cocos MD-104 SS10]
MLYRILVGSYTNEIYTVVFDSDASTLVLESTSTVGYHPSWITPHPTDRSIVFAGLEQTEGKVVTIKYDELGHGTLIGEVPSGGADPCTLLAAGTELLVGNYSSGTFATIPLSPEPPYLQASDTTIAKFTAQGPNKDRQEASHLHQVVLHPSRPQLLIPDLGGDVTRIFSRDVNGTWAASEHVVEYKAGGGPRHIAFHEDVLYTALELTNEVTAHRLPPPPAEPVLLATASTLRTAAPVSADPLMLVAEILIPSTNASFPTPLLYVSNRNDPSPAGDTIAIFDISSPHKLELAAEVRTGLRHLRGMLFGGPDNKWLIAGGVHGPGIKMLERVDGGRGLKELASLELAAPTGFLWL